jgi:hypothetical protein
MLHQEKKDATMHPTTLPKGIFCHQEALHAPPKVCGRLQRAGVRKAHVINFLKLNNIKLI